MERLIRYLSGDVPGGFVLWMVGILIILFLWWFLLKYSPVVNREKLNRFIYFTLGLIALTYVSLRLARPPKAENIYIGVLPLESKNGTNAESIAGWALAEMAAMTGQLASPDHIHFLRPEWLVDSYFEDSTSGQSLREPEKLFAWAKLIRLNYVVAGTVEEKDGSVVLNYSVNDVDTKEAVFQSTLTISKSFSAVEIDVAATALIKFVYEEIDEKPAAKSFALGIYHSPAAPYYFQARTLLAKELWDSAYAVSQKALTADSGSALGWYSSGAALTEKMVRTKEPRTRESHQRRAEYFLKKAIQLAEAFSQPYMSLAKNYVFIAPEPRYLDAEFAMIAANQVYNREYMLFYLLSFMQNIRWESFQMTSREQILKRAIEINPGGFHAYIALGQEYLKLSRPHDHLSQRALNNFVVGLQLKPNDYDAIEGMVMAYDRLSYFDQAIELQKRAITLFPDRADVHYSMGVLHFHKGEYTREKTKLQGGYDQFEIAEGFFKKAIELNNSAYARLYLGKIYDFQKKRDLAIEQFRIVMRTLSPEDRYREEARKKLREYFPDVEE